MEAIVWTFPEEEEEEEEEEREEEEEAEALGKRGSNSVGMLPRTYLSLKSSFVDSLRRSWW